MDKIAKALLVFSVKEREIIKEVLLKIKGNSLNGFDLKKLKIFRRANLQLRNLNLQRRQNHHFLHLLSLSYMLLLQNDIDFRVSQALMQVRSISLQGWLFW